MYEQPDSLLSERICCIVFKDPFAKNAAVQEIEKCKQQFGHILYRQDQRDASQVYSFLKISDPILPEIYHQTLVTDKQNDFSRGQVGNR